MTLVGSKQYCLTENKNNMANFQGKVAYYNEREWGGKMLYSFKLANDDQFYSLGEKDVKLSKGDYVSFAAKEDAKGRMQVDVRSIEVKAAEVAAPSTGTGGGWKGKSFGGKPAGARDSYWEEKAKADAERQPKIEWQAARNSAIAAAQVILANGGLKLPAKENAKFDAIVALIDDLTAKYFAETNNLDKMKADVVDKDTGDAVRTAPVEEDAQEEGWDD